MSIFNKKVFLGGTCSGYDWRQDLIPKLKINYFNPVVDDWNEQAQKNEIYEREHDDFVLYTITSDMKGIYSIAEVVDDSNKRPVKTILCILYDGFDPFQIKSLKALSNMVSKNGSAVFDNIDDVAEYLNKQTI